MLHLHLINNRLARLILIGAAVLSAACAPSQEMVLRLDDRSRIYLLTGTDLWEMPPTPVLKSWSAEDFESVLRRMIINISTWFGLVDSGPKPLFRESHVQGFTPVLAKYIPGLRADQRLRLRFSEPYRNLDVLVDVYADGNFLVFVFHALGQDLDSPDTSYQQYNRASIVLQSGQRLEKTPYLVILKEPIAREVLQLAKLRQVNLDTIEAALKDGILQEAEANQLREIVESADQLSDLQFERIMAKRRTLETALKQKLFSQEEYDARKEKLIEELKRISAPAETGATDTIKGG